MTELPKKMCTIFIALFLLHASSQEFKEGPCPKVQPMKDFDPDKFTLLWYEFGKTPLEDASFAMCTQYQHYPPKGSFWTASLDTINENGTRYISTSSSYITGVGEGKSFLDGTRFFYLDTDYISYASIYNCQEVGTNMHNDTLFLLTSSRNPTPDTIMKALQAFGKNNLNYQGIRSTNLCGCPDNSYSATTPQ